MNIEQDKVEWIKIHSELGWYDLSYARGLKEFRELVGKLIVADAPEVEVEDD